MPLFKIEDLYRIKGEIVRSSQLKFGKTTARVTVHMGTCGISSGADIILEILKEEVESCGRQDIVITTSGCAGICNREPLITVEMAGQEAVKYAELDASKVRRIFKSHVLDGQVVSEWVFARGWEQKEKQGDDDSTPTEKDFVSIRNLPFFKMQELRVMRNRGLIQAEKVIAAVSNELTNRIHDYFPHAQLATLKGAGHWVHADAPRELLQILRHFLASP